MMEMVVDRVRSTSVPRTDGFTLVELLVTVAIISVLAAMLFPVFSLVRKMAARSACVSNLRQVGLAVRLYRDDYDAYPPRLSALTVGYIGDNRVLICPSDAAKGQHTGNERLEGNQYLASGVSYDYVPRWIRAIELGWWQPPPNYGQGKWDELTPLADCQWHWASVFRPQAWDNDPGAHGWTLILTAGGSVRKIRVEDPLEEFTPERYR